MSPTLYLTRRAVPIAAILGVTVLLVMLVVANRSADAAGNEHQHGDVTAPKTAQQVAFHDQMRKLWEDHVTWTRLAIVTFADGSSGFPETAARLPQNQTDIGNAIKPFYGEAAGAQLTSLLHITIAVELLQAAKANDTGAFNAANARWYANANDIADFLAAANPRSWTQAEMRAGMKTHLDQTLAEAAHELGGDYAASVADYEDIHAHILAMADVLSSGIIRQFSNKLLG
jgi:hypothetical protein